MQYKLAWKAHGSVRDVVGFPTQSTSGSLFRTAVWTAAHQQDKHWSNGADPTGVNANDSIQSFQMNSFPRLESHSRKTCRNDWNILCAFWRLLKNRKCVGRHTRRSDLPRSRERRGGSWNATDAWLPAGVSSGRISRMYCPRCCSTAQTCWHTRQAPPDGWVTSERADLSEPHFWECLVMMWKSWNKAPHLKTSGYSTAHITFVLYYNSKTHRYLLQHNWNGGIIKPRHSVENHLKWIGKKRPL